ncbi:MAG: phage virion morphogenesis protein [Gallionellaceae bacterium]|nr:phage virion morphogenesis protein [Gallionellaceae bacterium]
MAQSEDVLRSIGETLLPIHKDRHLKDLAPDGTKWQDLAPATLKQKRKKRRKIKMLYEHGDLLGSFSYQVRGNTLYIGASDRKAVFHHVGTRRTDRHPGLPARPLLGFPDSDRRLVQDVLTDHLHQALQQARGG